MKQPVNEWIRRALVKSNFDRRGVMNLFNQFVSETGSRMNRRDFRSQIHKEIIKLKRRAGDSSNGTPMRVDDSQAKFAESGNYAEAETGRGRRIKTLEALIDECNIDLKVWNIEKHVVNKWEVGTRDQGGKIIVEPLFQVKAWLSKKVPDKTVFPPLQIVHVDVPKSKPFKIPKRKIKKALILSDAQMAFLRDLRSLRLEPFHDRLVFDLALQVAELAQPDLIVWNGDMFDLPDWSDKFIHTPDCRDTLQASLVELAWWIRQFKAVCPGAEQHFIPGNHEHRMDKAIIRNLSAAYGLKSIDNMDGFPALSLPNLLAVDKLEVKWAGDYPEAHIWLNDGLRVGHGTVVRAGSGDTVKAILREARYSELVGHVHRIEEASKTIHDGKGIYSVTVACFGTMARIDGIVPAKKDRNNWQPGFGEAEYDDRDFELHPTRVRDGRAIYRGKLLQGRDRSAEIARDTGWAALRVA